MAQWWSFARSAYFNSSKHYRPLSTLTELFPFLSGSKALTKIKKTLTKELPKFKNIDQGGGSNRLPKVLGKPQDEFKSQNSKKAAKNILIDGLTVWQWYQINTRIMQTSVDVLLHRRFLALLGVNIQHSKDCYI
jgi:hypothetical protein